MILAVAFVFMGALLAAWFASEFFANRAVRITTGICAIGISYGVAWTVGTLEGIEANIYFGTATKDLIQNTIVELENDRTDEVLAGLKELRREFQPSYETRDDYAELVDRYVRSLSESPIRHERGTAGWSRGSSR